MHTYITYLAFAYVNLNFCNGGWRCRSRNGPLIHMVPEQLSLSTWIYWAHSQLQHLGCLSASQSYVMHRTTSLLIVEAANCYMVLVVACVTLHYAARCARTKHTNSTYKRFLKDPPALFLGGWTHTTHKHMQLKMTEQLLLVCDNLTKFWWKWT